MRGKTRRQEIIGGYRREQIGVIALAIAVFMLLVLSCTGSCSCGKTDEAGETESGSQEETVKASGAVNINELWGRLDGDDRQFILSVTEYPRLVNRDNPLPTGYVPPDLIALHGVPDGENNRLNYSAANAYYQLRASMLEDGMAVLPLSAYRTYDEQTMIFNYNVQLHTEEGMTPEEAREYTEGFVSIPGTSEHQYGRSIDVTIDGTTNHSFHETEHGQWLIDHAHEFGFVIRYPEDKVEITGINYEPWHLRWVGVEHAVFMTRHNLCLEEYVELIQKYNPSAVMYND